MLADVETGSSLGVVVHDRAPGAESDHRMLVGQANVPREHSECLHRIQVVGVCHDEWPMDCALSGKHRVGGADRLGLFGELHGDRWWVAPEVRVHDVTDVGSDHDDRTGSSPPPCSPERGAGP